MYICFICKQNFDILMQLLSHFTSDHKLKTYGDYKCAQKDCYQHFSSKFAFKKHLLRHNENEIENMENLSLGSFKSIRSNVKINENNQLESNHSQTISHVELENVPKKSIFDLALNFSCDLYAKDNMTRKDSVEIQKNVTRLCESIVETIKDALSSSTQNFNLCEINNILDECSNPFRYIGTEYKFIKYIENKQIFEGFYCHTINNEIKRVIKFGKPTQDEVSVKAYIMPLRFQFKKIFQNGNVFEKTIQNTSLLEHKSGYSNFINGSLFRQKKDKIGDNKIIIPYFIYMDDFEVNNPLGSHASVDSICGIYYSFPTIPQYLLSDLNYIFVAGIIKTKYIKEFGSNSSFYILVQEIKFLEESGIDIVIRDKVYHVHFVLGLILGDNLGLKSVLGFCKSFNCEKFCRLCERKKNDLKRDSQEHKEYLRNSESYNKDIVIDDYKITGIIENSIFNEINSFHVTDNFTVDIMHDIFEGICRYEICHAILYFIDNKYFSLDFLNIKKQNFCYGETEIGNLSNPLQMKHLKTSNLKMTARETWTFINFLPLLIGNKIPQNDKIWKIISLLIKIIDICLYTNFSKNDIDLLKCTIKKHHELYVKEIGLLKPKHHFLTHYATVIEKCGPLKYLWSLRFEAKHKILKKYSNVTFSRKNIAYSLAMKMSFQFASFLQKPIDFENCLNFVSEDKNINKEFFEFLKSLKLNIDNFQFAKNVVYKGTTYKKKFYLTNMSEKLRLFKILALLIENNSFFLITNEIRVKCFDEHYQSFEVKENTKSIFLHPITFFTSPPIHLYNMSNGLAYIRNKIL